MITLADMARTPITTIKRIIIGLVVLCVFAITPRSLAEEILSPILGTVKAQVEIAPEALTKSPDSTESPTTTPTPSLSNAPSSTPMPNSPASVVAPDISTSELVTASTSPTPAPAHAIADQQLRVAVPTSVSTDPRARSVFLPRLHASGVETLLICGYSSASSVNFASSIQGVQSEGSGSPYFRISGPAHLVMAALNGEMGARVTSTSKAIPGSVVTLSFIALSKPSISKQLCNDGIPSNNRTISFRALSMDLNMIKDPVRLN